MAQTWHKHGTNMTQTWHKTWHIKYGTNMAHKIWHIHGTNMAQTCH